MDLNKRKLLKITAAMEGQEVIVANIGKKVSLSEMEMICLVNFAEIGLMSIFAALDGKAGEEAEASLNEHMDRIREQFGGENGRDGLNQLATSCAAMLRGRRFFQY